MGKMKEIYKTNKTAEIGDVCICPSCKSKFIKEHCRQVFCKTRPKTQCKDKYWNTVTPAKRNNTTRISPASKAFMSNPDRVTGYTSEGYRIIGGVAYDEFDDPVYDIDVNDNDHPFDVGDAGDHGNW